MTLRYIKEKVGKLSIAQKRALGKMTNEWQSAYDLGESIQTLKILVSNGIAEIKEDVGSILFPRVSIYFRLKAND